ncbi:hypothetical protein EJ05DRAFT_258931 [Pseudovirgaria hyperparasitica]|uniref:Uncharacterized protein n=1 Tax=Pseudovirgaria hyperparasitica TaxID=470096 RepID=A0A6A6WF03_9PEZI|nr:uncharacterized protein EJ05DRAFT_258931 [Pseudovirgaria hyperparasitica]KAF2761303.1 hypothetical protein EJ05DRAFT_258931 [Pseudovirgaria hyperparasitica]
MASKQTFSTHDLRSAATENQRSTLDQKRKWAHGSAFGPGRLTTDVAHARPARPDNREPSGVRRDGIAVATFKARSREGRKADINEYYDSGDSSAPEEVDEASAAPEPDAEVAYSFDAASGPSHGSQILSAALAKAVERYEVVATDKLVREEYEVLGSDGEPVVKAKGKGKAMKPPQSAPEAAADEDDFELI